jgi:DNA primase
MGILTQRKEMRADARLPNGTPASAVETIRLLGIRFSNSGEEASARCPLPGHGDRRPSWSLNLRTGAWHCFGCQESGGLRKLVMAVRNVPYEVADAWLYKIKLDQPPAVQGTPAERAAVRTRAVADPDADVRALDLLSRMDAGDPTDEALDARGLTREAADLYRIGWDYDCWIFLMFNAHTGELAGYQVKSETTGEVLNSEGVHKSATLFGIELGQKGRPVVLVESPIDAARVYAATGMIAVASFGAEVSYNQLWLLDRKGASTVIFALDDDDAGRLATQKALAAIRDSKTYTFQYKTLVFDYPPGSVGKDPGELTDDEIVNGLRNARQPTRR